MPPPAQTQAFIPIAPFPNQGQPIAPAGYVQIAPGLHKPSIAFLLGFLLVGGGQFYNRQPGKAVLLMFLAILFSCPTVYIGTAVIWIFAFIEASATGARLERGEMIAAWQWF